jgi:outer membrane receptor protein involved in Fe transport
VINNKIEVNRQLAANGFYPGDENRTFISQEFQFVGSAFDDRLRYTTGIFGSRETIDDSVTGVAIAPGGILGVPLSGDQVLTVPSQLAGLRNIDVSEYENTSWALFSQVILSLTEQWQLTLGGRYTRESKEALQLNYISASQPPGVVSREEYDALYNFEHELILNPEQPQSVGDASWNVFSPAATLTLFIPEDVKLKYVDSGMTYISVSEGFKAGGFSPFADRFLSFDPEEILSYELGLKMDLFEHRLRINSAIYYTDYQDIQLRVTRTFGDLNTLTGLTNAGEAAIRGAELELAVLATPNLLLGFNASYISPEYKEFFDEDSNGDAIDRSDDPFAYIPRRNFTLTAQYDREFSTGSAMASLSGFYQDSIFIGLDAGASADSAAYLPDYWLWNTRFSFKPLVVDGLDIAVYVNNLFDKDYFATGNFSVGGIGAASLIKGKPRTFGLDVKYSW